MTLHITTTRGLLRALGSTEGAYIQFSIMGALMECPGRVISVEDIITIVYRGCREPVDARHNIYVAVWKLRQRGIKIERECYRGYSFGRAA